MVNIRLTTLKYKIIYVSFWCKLMFFFLALFFPQNHFLFHPKRFRQIILSFQNVKGTWLKLTIRLEGLFILSRWKRLEPRKEIWKLENPFFRDCELLRKTIRAMNLNEKLTFSRPNLLYNLELYQTGKAA